MEWLSPVPHMAHVWLRAPTLCPRSRLLFLRIRISLIVSQRAADGHWSVSAPGVTGLVCRSLGDRPVPHLQITQPYSLEMDTKLSVFKWPERNLLHCLCVQCLPCKCFVYTCWEPGEVSWDPACRQTPTRTVMGWNNHQNTTHHQ